MPNGAILLQPRELEKRLAELGEGTPSLSAVHGLMTAVIVGPEPVLPDQWLPYALSVDGQIPEMEDKAEIESLVLSIFGFYNDTVAYLDDGEFQPYLGSNPDPDNKMDNLAVWCVGFSKGMQFCEEKWFAKEHQRLAELLVSIYYFIEPGRFITLYLGDDATEDKIFELDMLMWTNLPESVQAIRDYWREHGDSNGR